MELIYKFDAFIKSFSVAHPRDHREPGMLLNSGTPWLPFLAVAIYIFLVFSLPKILKNVRPIRLKWLVAFWNLGLSAFSFCVLVGVTPPYAQIYFDNGFFWAFCGRDDLYYQEASPMLYWIYIFCLSKFIELFDTLFLILRKRDPPFLHWFHHATVLLYCWFASYYHTVAGFNFVVMNAFVHTLMYFYYFLSQIGLRPPEFVALIITIIQISQMFFGIAIISGTAYIWYSTGTPCLSDEPEIILISGILMYGTYLFLFVQFFVKRYFGKKPVTNNKTKKTQKKTQ